MPQRKNKLLIDADYLVALYFTQDSGHDWSFKIAQKIEKENTPVVISSPAFGEAVTVLSQRAGKPIAITTAEYILNNPIEIIEVTPSLRKSALKWSAQTKSKNTRFTDCINMAILDTWKSKIIVSRDKHYFQCGFQRLGID